MQPSESPSSSSDVTAQLVRLLHRQTDLVARLIEQQAVLMSLLADRDEQEQAPEAPLDMEGNPIRVAR